MVFFNGFCGFFVHPYDLMNFERIVSEDLVIIGLDNLYPMKQEMPGR